MPDNKSEDEKILALMRTADPVAEYQKLYDQLEGAKLQTYLGAGTMAADLLPMTYAGSRAGKAGKALAAGAPPVKRVKPYKLEESQFRSGDVGLTGTTWDLPASEHWHAASHSGYAALDADMLNRNLDDLKEARKLLEKNVDSKEAWKLLEKADDRLPGDRIGEGSWAGSVAPYSTGEHRPLAPSLDASIASAHGPEEVLRAVDKHIAGHELALMGTGVAGKLEAGTGRLMHDPYGSLPPAWGLYGPSRMPGLGPSQTRSQFPRAASPVDFSFEYGWPPRKVGANLYEGAQEVPTVTTIKGKKKSLYDDIPPEEMMHGDRKLVGSSKPAPGLAPFESPMRTGALVKVPETMAQTSSYLDDLVDMATGGAEFGISMLPFVGGAYEAASGYSDMGDIEGQMEALYTKATPGQRAMMDEYIDEKSAKARAVNETLRTQTRKMD